MLNKERIEKAKELTNEISPTFCLAKWHHTTIYLQTGETHSCYHPPPHVIPIHEIKRDPSALHNTQEKKLQRLDMLKGNKPKGCQYCWNIESMGEEYISDRHERNASIYTEKRIKEIKENTWDFNVKPEYIEISFGNECNFKCGYCHPKASNSFYKEIEKYGPYDTVKNHRCDIDWLKIYPKEEENPYVDAWWEWWPQIKYKLTILRITGGEPLLQPSTWKLFDDIIKKPLPNLELNVNSNFGVKPILIERLSEKANRLSEKYRTRFFKVFTSIDTWGNRAEYIRHGLDITTWESNLDYYLSNTRAPVTFMITFNILTVTSFKLLLEKILEWREKYNYEDSKQWQRIRFDTPYLKEPLQYDMNILPKDEFMPYMYESLKFIEDNLDDENKSKFQTLEYEKFKRVVKYMETTEYPKEKITEGRRDFYNWFTEHDRRRNTDFHSVFPEYTQFMNLCKSYER
jgi:hypothetical protein